MTATVAAIRRYPVKGLSEENLESVTLKQGQCLPHDRRFALAHGTSRYDNTAPAWMAKANFLMLARDEKLAQLRVRFEEEGCLLTLLRDGKPVVTGNPCDLMGRTLIGQFFAGFMAGATRGTPKLVEAENVAFTDVPEKWISIISLASVHDLERVTRETVDARRFRGNIYIEGSAPWAEFAWVGEELRCGDLRLRVVEPIGRCTATNVNPDTATRDMNIPLSLKKGFGHMNMGVYAEVIADGALRPGDTLSLV